MLADSHWWLIHGVSLIAGYDSDGVLGSLIGLITRLMDHMGGMMIPIIHIWHVSTLWEQKLPCFPPQV